MPPKPPESELKRLAELLRMSLSELKELMRHGVIVQTDSGSIDTAQSLLSISRHLLSTRSTAEAKARAAKAEAELKELKTAEAKRKVQLKQPKEETKKIRRKGGSYKPEIAVRILERLCAGESQKHACEAEGISERTVDEWRKLEPDFAQQYPQARARGWDSLGDRILWLLEEVLNVVNDTTLEPAEKSVRLQGYKVVLDNLKWMLSKMLPKIYGDRTQMVLESANPADILPKHTDEQDAAFLAKLAAIQAKTPPPEDITHTEDE